MCRNRTYREIAIIVGCDRYCDVLNVLIEAGIPAEFSQTGGMCAAIEATVESGHVLLITDAEDSLAWDRSAHAGWGVGLYPPEDQAESVDGPLVWVSDQDGSVEALLPLVRLVLLGGPAR